MSDGFIFDVYPDYRKDVMVIWRLTANGAKKREQMYHPSFYVSADSSEQKKIAQMLQELPQVKQVNLTRRKTQLGTEKEKLVLQVTPAKLQFFHHLARMVDSWGKFHRYQLYNVDIRLPTRFLQENNLFFNAFVSWDENGGVCHDEQWAVDYAHPQLKRIQLDLNRNKNQHHLCYTEPIKEISIDHNHIQEENEVDTILSAIRFIKKSDPDMIFTRKGDSILFPLLLHRAQQHHIAHKLFLGREKTPLRARKQDESYMSYGRILYRPAFYTLKGRMHIDMVHSFFYAEAGWYGLVDVSRCANISSQVLSRLGAGTAISQMQVNKAMQQGYLIPWKKTRSEQWKTAGDLLCSDRGGIILEPVVGLHEQVVELDYASLYPNIMVQHNISPETLSCECCPSSTEQVPQIGYHICREKRGLIPAVLDPVLSRRFLFKARSKNNRFDKNRYEGLQQAWKWVLLVCFGYTGYRNARYGRIECHESITAFSRSVLLAAMHLVEQAGYEVLHGIVDSLWVKEKNPMMKPFLLSRMISKKTGIRLDLEGRYHWIVFLPNKGTGVGALNRYYGLFDNNTLKTRGIELRQHSTPVFFKQLQQEMLQVFTQAKNAEDFQRLITDALVVARKYALRLVHHKVMFSDLLFTTIVSKTHSQYKVNNAVKGALIQLQKMNIVVHPGQSVRYIIQHHDAKIPERKICIAENLTGETRFDTLFYLRFLCRCVESLLIPFGYDEKTVQELLLKQMYGEC